MSRSMDRLSLVQAFAGAAILGVSCGGLAYHFAHLEQRLPHHRIWDDYPRESENSQPWQFAGIAIVEAISMPVLMGANRRRRNDENGPTNE